MNIEVFFEPRILFDKRIDKMGVEYKTLSQLIRNWNNEKKEAEIIDELIDYDYFLITLEDCSGAASHVLENFDYLLYIFKHSKMKSVFINNPPKFFYDKLKQLSENVYFYEHKFSKINEKKVKNIQKNFDERIIGQSNAKKSIIRKLVAHMIRPTQKPLVLMFYGRPGIGKTETAKYLSEILYGSDSILREQMSMVGGENSVKYFKSTSHNEDSFSKHLLNRISNVILLDEFALAPSYFQTSFFQMFDEGIYSDQNFNVSVENSIIICTSNLLTKNELEENVDLALLSRFDGFIYFSEFSNVEKRKIVEELFDEFTRPKYMKKKYRDSLDKEQILGKIYENIPNLTNVRNIRKYVEDCISDYLISEVINN